MPKILFPEGMGVVHKTCGNSRGVGGFFCIHRNSGEGGDLHEIPSVVGACGYFLEVHILDIDMEKNHVNFVCLIFNVNVTINRTRKQVY